MSFAGACHLVRLSLYESAVGKSARKLACSLLAMLCVQAPWGAIAFD